MPSRQIDRLRRFARTGAGVTCATLLGISGGWLAGCGSCAEQSTRGEERAGASETVAEPKARFGKVRGVVRLAEGTELPSYDPDAERLAAKQFVSQETAAWPEQCTPPKVIDRQPVRLGPSGGLSNVLVAATDYKQKVERPPQIHEVAIEDCRLTPQVIAAQKGDKLHLTNRTDYPFMPKLPTDPFIRATVYNQTHESELEQPGLLPLTCTFTALCGRTDIIVLQHPVFTLTKDDGTFEIDNVPAGEELKLNAWHPLFRETNLQVRVEPGETKSVEILLYPVGSEPSAETSGSVDSADGEAKDGAEQAVPGSDSDSASPTLPVMPPKPPGS